MKKYLKFISSAVLVSVSALALTSCDFNSIINEIFGGESSEPKKDVTPVVVNPKGVIYDDFQIHFMMLGNEYAGDSIYIKAGENDILIDAGSRQSSASTIESYVDQYCTDNTLEYVIATHADQDHIAGFSSTSKVKGIYDYYDVTTTIDFALTNKTTQTYNNYVTARDNEAKIDKNHNHYTAADCFNEKNGAKKSYQLSENVKMDILYNYYYFNNSSDENNYSVCTMFTYTKNDESHYFLLTGDLEKDGEAKLSDYYKENLPHVDLFKAGHHGSKTSSNDCLLEYITPSMCVISTAFGTSEYTGVTDNQFPTQAFIDRIKKYTDKVYCTSMYQESTIKKAASDGEVAGVKKGEQYFTSTGYQAMNGNICISMGTDEEGNNCQLGLACSNNDTILKDQEAFNKSITLNKETRNYRTW